MALKKEDLEKVGQKLSKAGQTEWPISDDLRLVGMASGIFVIQGKTGGKIELEDLSADQERLIRAELDMESGKSGWNPSERDADADHNPLVPDDHDFGSPTVNGAIKAKKKKDKKSDFDNKDIFMPGD